MAVAAVDVAANLKTILNSVQQILTSTGRKNNVHVLAVSKTKPHYYVEEAYKIGHRHFGENYVNELCDKAPLCPSDIKWHFIGHLQSNKAAKLVSIPNLYMVESVDSLKLAEKLNAACKKVGRADPLKILVQVNTSGEESKSGCEPDACVDLVRDIQEFCPNLKISGLMTIGQYEVEPTAVFFETLNKCKDEVFAEFPQYNTPEWEMSMGMSHDMELAIRNGATTVRVGTAIFGPRGYIVEDDSN